MSKAFFSCALAACLVACTPALPDGVDCSQQTFGVSDDGSLAEALGQAQDGDCVVLRGGEYHEAISLDRSITLVAERDASVQILGADHNVVVRVPTKGAKVIGLQITKGSGLGLLVSAAAVELRDLDVQDMDGGAIGIRCQDAGCAREGAAIIGSGLHTEGGAFGLGMDGGQLKLSDSVFRAHRSTGLQPGLGLFASGSSNIDAQRIEVSDNDTGAVLDGALVQARLSDMLVENNDDRGLWVQGLRGDSSSPALQILGDSRFISNGYVGLGLFDSVGARLEGATIRKTRALPVPSDLNQVDDIGDGLALLQHSADVEVIGSQLRDNARAQLLVDLGGSGLRVDDSSTIVGADDAFAAVVQNTSGSVSLPTGSLSSTRALPVRSDPGLGLPGLSSLDR